jgi:hypothetical protein
VIPAIWSISGDVAITVLAAVIVAVFTGLLTAFTTNKRLDKQLAHDREIKDVEELRSLLDDAATSIAEAMENGADLLAIAIVQKETAVVEFQLARSKCAKNRDQILHMEERIGLRLGRDHAVTGAYEQVSRAVSVLLHAHFDHFPLSKAETEAARHTGDQITEAKDRFIEAGRQYVGSQIRLGSQIRGN